jgi:hypothetical protein
MSPCKEKVKTRSEETTTTSTTTTLTTTASTTTTLTTTASTAITRTATKSYLNRVFLLEKKINWPSVAPDTFFH